MAHVGLKEDKTLSEKKKGSFELVSNFSLQRKAEISRNNEDLLAPGGVTGPGC